MTSLHESARERGQLTVSPAQRRALLRYVRVLGAAEADAEDLVQEACLVALRRAGFDGSSPGGVFVFLRTTARQLWLRSQKRRLSEREVREADAIWDARCADDTGDIYVQALRMCISALPEKSRALLAATYADGDGRPAAGARVGLRPNGVKTALRRLRRFLHDCIRRRTDENSR